jgi:transcriptional regulator with XRE-family HTH domain
MTINDMNYKLGAARKAGRELTARRAPEPHEIVQSFIKDRKLTQKEFAKKVGVSLGAVSQWLSKKRKVPGPVLAYIKLAKDVETAKWLLKAFDPRECERRYMEKVRAESSSKHVDEAYPMFSYL